MIPVHMGLMTPARAVLMPTSVAVVSKPAALKKDVVSIRAKEAEEGSGPTTTVFVGNISEKASDMLIRQLLAVRDEIWRQRTDPCLGNCINFFHFIFYTSMYWASSSFLVF